MNDACGTLEGNSEISIFITVHCHSSMRRGLMDDNKSRVGFLVSLYYRIRQ